MVGVTGATVSTVTFMTVDAVLVFPDESVAVAVKPWPPSVNVDVPKLQAPLPLATTLPSSVEPS